MPTPPGEGTLRVERSAGRSVVARALAASPLRLLTPRNHGVAAWAYAVNFGGGLVDGDQLRLRVEVGPGAAAVVTTQAHAKVYRSPRGCGQSLEAHADDGALFVSIPDPVVCFAGARFEQGTRVSLASGASAVLVEAFTCGRAARGERWEFARYAARTEISRGGALVLADAVVLDGAHGPVAARMAPFEAFGTVVALGPRAAAVREALLGARERGELRVISASALGDDGAIARVAARSGEVLAGATRELLRALPGMLGDDPLARKW